MAMLELRRGIPTRDDGLRNSNTFIVQSNWIGLSRALLGSPFLCDSTTNWPNTAEAARL